MGSDSSETAPPFITRYVFSLEGVADAREVGKAADGSRLDLQYESDRENAITTNSDKFASAWWEDSTVTDRIEGWLTAVGCPLDGGSPYAAVQAFRRQTEAESKKWPPKAVEDLRSGRTLPWFGLEGTIESGSDWILLRNDGVAEFSGRFTLRSGDDDGGLISAAFSGIVDAFKADGAKTRDGTFSTSPPETYTKEGLPLLLTATFDAAGAAPNWAPSKLRTQAAAFWKYQRLTQSQFIAVGKATLGSSGYLVTRVNLDVYETRPGPVR